MTARTIQRRSFLTLLGGAAAAWPMGAGAQQDGRVRVIGYLSTREPDAANVVAFRHGLNNAGYVEGRNVAIEYLSAENRYDRLPALAAELVRRQVAVIAANSTPVALSAKAATQSLPIVFQVGVDPVATGLVSSLNRPGGNLTGVSQLINEVVAKRLQILCEMVPAAALVAVLSNPANPVPSAAEVEEARRAAQVLGVRLLVLNAGTPSEIDDAFATIVQQKAGALLVGVDAYFRDKRNQIIRLASRHRLPAIYAFRESPSEGGLMSYGNDASEAQRVIGNYAGRILKGEKPGDLPVQQVTKIELIINMNAAKALGLTFPITLLGRADEVIE